MHCDAVVVGLGPGGEHVAGQLAEAGLDVVGIEAELVGGECPYWGCIPSKMMVWAAGLLAAGRRVPGNAGTSVVTPDWAPVAGRIRDEATDSWDDTVAVDRFLGKGGHFIRGRARVTGASSVEVNGEEIIAGTALVLAAGARAWVPPMFEEIPHWTNREAIATETIPGSLLVVGGGPVGLEIGQVMARFGAAVTIVEMDERLASTEEPEVSEMITDILRREGVTVRTGVRIVRVESHAAGGCTAHFADGSSADGRTRVGRHWSSFGSGPARSGRPRARCQCAQHSDRRPHAGPAGCLGGWGRHRKGGIHPCRHVSGPDLCGGHPRT